MPRVQIAVAIVERFQVCRPGMLAYQSLAIGEAVVCWAPEMHDPVHHSSTHEPLYGFSAQPQDSIGGHRQGSRCLSLWGSNATR